jgi:hypothetical protein
MTITLDYTDLHFEEDSDVMSASALEFQFEMLAALVVFRVDGRDFSFEQYTTLLDAAAILQGRVNLLGDGETSSYENPLSSERLNFSRTGDQVTIAANYTQATATVGYTELHDAVTAFWERVARDLLQRYPGLDEAPGARDYFTEPLG